MNAVHGGRVAHSLGLPRLRRICFARDQEG